VVYLVDLRLWLLIWLQQGAFAVGALYLRWILGDFVLWLWICLQ
jgi:hypothetical protein